MIEYDKDAIVPPYITSYLRAEMTHENDFLHELETYAEQNAIPIAEPETARFIEVLARIKNPERLLEIGCAIGYSAIRLAGKMSGKITTIEYNPDMVKTARENVEKAGLSDKIEVVEADAKDYLSYMDGEEIYDYIFLDGPKAHYIYMLDDCVRLLKHGGILVADNVLYKGMVPDPAHVVRRKITIVKRLRKFVDALMEHPELETSLLPLGDGVTVSVRK